MSSYGEPSPRISALITDLAHDIDKIAPRLAEHITANVEFYRATGAVSREELVEACHAQLSAVLGRFGSAAHFDTSFARASGHRRAAAGVPVSAIMDAYRVGSAFIWKFIADAIATAGIPGDDLIAVTAQLCQVQDVFTEAMSEGYRAEATSRLLTQETERAARWKRCCAARSWRTRRCGSWPICCTCPVRDRSSWSSRNSLTSAGTRSAPSRTGSTRSTCARRGGCFPTCRSGSSPSR